MYQALSITDLRWFADLGDDRFTCGVRDTAARECRGCGWHVAFRHGASPGMMKSQAAVLWHRQTDSRIHQGSTKMDADHTAPGARGGKNRATAERAKTPLRTIKYSSAIQRRALGSIPTALCNKPPRKLLLQTTTTRRACSGELRNSLNYLWPHSRPHWMTYWWIGIELRALHESLNITSLMAVQVAQYLYADKLGRRLFNAERNVFSHLPAWSIHKLMTQAVINEGSDDITRLTTCSIKWVKSKLSIKTPSMNQTRPIQTAIRS